MRVTFLGSGTSQGIPVIACNCPVCYSIDPHDKRLRSSVMIEMEGKVIVIDSGPDFRQQMLRQQVKKLDAVVFTHEHKDHISGLDDVRAFNFIQKKHMPVYGADEVLEALKREFHYAFSDTKYPGVPEITLNRIENSPFDVEGIQFNPILVTHYLMPVFGFRIGDFTYITDAKAISDEEKEKIKGSKVIVLNALRKTSHISHFTLDEAVSIINEFKPERAYLTHISHLMGKHEDINMELPPHIQLAYDGLILEV